MSENPKNPTTRIYQQPSGMASGDLLEAARAGDSAAFGLMVEPYRRELLTHCYRMLGSLLDAEDLVQETYLRAWRRLDTFEGRAPLRAWLYKIATNACLDALARRPKRSLPMELFVPADPHAPIKPAVTDPVWLDPFPDGLLAPVESSPEARYDARESITLAFMVALQVLPPRQRCVLILRDVLDWRAGEVADTLGISLPAVNSLLYRARASLGKHYHGQGRRRDILRASEVDERVNRQLDRYVSAWEKADVDGIIALLKEDATFPMPPLPQWYQGRPAIRAFIAAIILPKGSEGRWRLRPLKASGRPGFACYQRDDGDGAYRAYAIQVLTFDGDQIADITTFGIPGLFTFFDLPDVLAD